MEKYGVSAKPGDRVVITKFEVRPDRIVFEFNDGPEKHHHILQHIEVGGMGGMAPLAQDDGHVPVGARMQLVFTKFVPEMTASDVRKLIAPMIDFSLKTPVEAFADTLPPKLKGAVLNHEVLVGMNREMVLKAVGQPDQKVREMDGQTAVRGMDLWPATAPGPVCSLQWQSRHPIGDCRCWPAAGDS